MPSRSLAGQRRRSFTARRFRSDEGQPLVRMRDLQLLTRCDGGLAACWRDYPDVTVFLVSVEHVRDRVTKRQLRPITAVMDHTSTWAAVRIAHPDETHPPRLMSDGDQQTRFCTHSDVANQFVVVVTQDLRKSHDDDLKFPCASLLTQLYQTSELLVVRQTACGL